MSAKRHTTADVIRRNGAWLVSLGLNELTEDSTPDELYDCASSLPVAKRLAVEMARRHGFEGALRWTCNSPNNGWWSLEMTLPLPDWDEED